MKRLPIYIALTLLAVAAFSGCSTKKNTASSRFWQSFVTRYNVYYNGSEAYKEGCLAKEQGNKDNYTEMLPYFLVGNEKSRDLGKSNFETAITKCEKAIQLHSIKKKPVVNPSKRRSPKMKAYLSRQEFNPFLKNAWLLMGRAQFQKGDFIEAASTFSYIARHYAPEPLVAAEARTWLARCYAQLDWFYDAEDALDKARRDTLNKAIRREMLFTETDLLLRQQRYAEALPLLQQAAKKEKRKQQKARLYFLLGQVNLHLDKKREAAEALRKCIKQSPPYELSFNARILQTEAFTSPDEARSMVKRLRRMARDGSNKDYLDQVYYAMGNIHLTLGDTAQAIGSYETGRAKSTRGGAEKGMLLLRLGELYWERGRYDLAQSCYGEAVGLLDKTHEAYEETMRRSKVLDELVPFTSAVHLQDSLQQLALMSEEERNAAIDRTIELLKRKEEAEREAREDSAAEARMQENAAAGGTTRPTTQTGQTAVGGNKEWYFYNPMLVMQGKQDFKKRWGNRKLEDNWRRSNRTVVPMDDMAGVDYEAEDSIRLAEERADSLALAEEEAAAQPDSAQNDPHRREYYLKDIPFTPEAKAASDLIIMDGLYNAGLIEKDKLEDFPLAARTLTRLADQYPTFEKMDDVFYQLFLLYARWGQADKAAEMKARMAQLFPESALTTLITDPDYERYARYGRQIEDSLYTATYEAYRRRDNATVARNFEESTRRFPTGANRPKFMFVHILSRIGHEDTKQITTELRDLLKQFPESDVSELAGMLVNGLESGRTFNAAGLDLGSLWSRRTAAADAATDSVRAGRRLLPDRDVPFVFVVAYPTDSIDDNRLLYELARFNFTGFMVRNFDITPLRDAQLTQFRVAGFNSFDEAHTYAQQVYADTTLARMLTKARVVLISTHNLEMLGTQYSFDDYRKFYEQTFAPMEIKDTLPLDMQDGPVETHYEDEYTPEQLEDMQDDSATEDDEGEWYSE